MLKELWPYWELVFKSWVAILFNGVFANKGEADTWLAKGFLTGFSPFPTKCSWYTSRKTMSFERVLKEMPCGAHIQGDSYTCLLSFPPVFPEARFVTQFSWDWFFQPVLGWTGTQTPYSVSVQYKLPHQPLLGKKNQMDLNILVWFCLTAPQSFSSRCR